MQFVWEVKIGLGKNQKTMLFYTKDQAVRFIDHNISHPESSQKPNDTIYYIEQKAIHGQSYIEELESKE